MIFQPSISRENRDRFIFMGVKNKSVPISFPHSLLTKYKNRKQGLWPIICFDFRRGAACCAQYGIGSIFFVGATPCGCPFLTRSPGRPHGAAPTGSIPKLFGRDESGPYYFICQMCDCKTWLGLSQLTPYFLRFCLYLGECVRLKTDLLIQSMCLLITNSG